MAFNGSGTFQRIYNWVNDKAANIKVRADRMDVEMDGMATGLSTCITKDGQTTVTANLPMANFKHTGVATGTNRTDYAALGQVQDSKANWVAAGGTVDAITATYSPAITALVDGQECNIRTSGTNATTTPTFAPNGLTARTIVKNGGTALVAGDMPLEAILRYTLASTRWELLNPNYPFVPAAGAPFIDSTAIIKGSSDATKLLKIEVDGLTTATTRTWTAPDADLTVVGTATAQTLTNKTLTSPTLTTPDIGVATGTSFNTITGVATQANQETATSIVTAVTPGRQQYHPSAAKAWVNFNGTGTPAINASYNVTSITDGGVGIYTVNFTTSFSSANYGVSSFASKENDSAGYGVIFRRDSDTFTSSACQIRTVSDSAAAIDTGKVNVTFFGDQ